MGVGWRDWGSHELCIHELVSIIHWLTYCGTVNCGLCSERLLSCVVHVGCVKLARWKLRISEWKQGEIGVYSCATLALSRRWAVIFMSTPDHSCLVHGLPVRPLWMFAGIFFLRVAIKNQSTALCSVSGLFSVLQCIVFQTQLTPL